MDRDEIAAKILAEVARRCAEIAARPKPQAWQIWAVRRDADDREYGPRYSPAWFGELHEADRVRFLRTVYRLHAAGLIAAVKSEGGRLDRVQITDAGRAAVAEMKRDAQPKKAPRGKRA